MINPRALYHPMLLRSFMAVADEGGFSKAARHLNLRQSTLSQHIAKLERAVGRPLVWRTTRNLSVTPDGQRLLAHARQILATYERAQRSLQRSTLRGTVRLGASEEFAIERLAPILSDFKRVHDGVDLEVTIGTSSWLEELYRADQLDLMIAQRRVGATSDTPLRLDTTDWFAVPGFALAADEPLPVVLPAGPHLMRDMALEALTRSDRKWRETCTVGSYLGLRAAVIAGLGVTALYALGRPLSLEPVRPNLKLPELPPIALVMLAADSSPAVMELEASIRASER